MKTKWDRFIKFLAIGLSFIVAIIMSFKLLTQYLTDEIKNNPKSDLQNNSVVRLLLSLQNDESESYPNVPLVITKINEIPNQYPEINLLEGAEKSWDLEIIYIFSSWCAHCQRELKEIEKIRTALAKSSFGNRIKIVGLAYDSNYYDIMAMVHSYPTIFDRLGAITIEEGMEFGIITLPLILIINKEGTIVYKETEGFSISDVTKIKRLYDQNTGNK